MAKICVECGREFPWQITINGVRQDLSCRKYCLKCHPIGVRYGREKVTHICKKCGKKISIQYKYRKGDKSFICLDCIPRRTTIKKYCITCGRETSYGRKYCSKKCIPSKLIITNKKLHLYKRRLLLKQKALELNGNLSCSCGENNIYLLEFHHEQEKEFQISDKIYNYSPNKEFPKDLVDEIKKCSVLCKKCHIKQHPELRSTREEKKLELYKYSGSKCKDCNETDIIFMHWHHRNTSTKKFEIGRGIKDGRSLKSLKLEVDKCDMLCTNCHILRFKQKYEKEIGYDKHRTN